MKVRRCSCCFHRRPTVRDYPFPSTSHRRCQERRRCGMSHQTPQRPFGRCRGQWLWMKVRRCSCCFHRRPTVHWNRIPSTSYRRCQGWRRCDSLQQTSCCSNKQRKSLSRPFPSPVIPHQMSHYRFLDYLSGPSTRLESL